MSKQMLIGMTGGIGSGKNKAAEIFETFGFYTIDADVVSRAVMEVGATAYEKIVAAFGTEILQPDKSINRKMLGSLIFADKSKRQVLESITHPAILHEEKRRCNAIKGKNSKALIITHAPLMVESGSFKNYDIVIAVYASQETRIRRVMARDNISEEIALKIINNQAPEEEKLKIAQIIINNDGDTANLIQEVERAANLIKLIVYGNSHS